MKLKILTLVCFGVTFQLAGQQKFGEKAEIGFLACGSYYTGELNRMGHFQQLSVGGGGLFRYDINPRVAIRGTALYGKVKGSDANSSISSYQNRNLNFQSILVEGALGLEFNYFTYVTNRVHGQRYWYSPYLFIQVAAFYFNPKSEYNGAIYELQPLGTEGQGTVLNSKSNYKRVQPSVPIGLGFKLNLTKKIQINAEYGIRLTFTDYLDDVGGTYVDPVELASYNGNVAAAFSDRSISNPGRNAGMLRGDGAFKDWYAFFGIGLTFKLGERDKCPMKEQ